jgi:putative spermidine/putrescine transport system permease protein
MNTVEKNRLHQGKATASKVFLAIYLFCIFIPLAVMVVWSFTNAWPWPELIPSGFSLRGLHEIFNEYARFGDTIVMSVFIALAASMLSVTAATLFARALVHHTFFGKEALRFGALLPFIVPTTVFAMGTQILFLRLGIANTPFGVILADSVISLPYATAIMLDVTAAVGMRLEEQAKVLGANRLRVVKDAVLPSLLPGLLSAASMAYIMAYMQYFLVLLIGGGKVKTIAIVMFPFLSGSDRTIASAYALVFVLISVLVFMVFEFIYRRFSNVDEIKLHE